MISVGSRDINAFEINLDINFVHRNKDQVKRKVIWYEKDFGSLIQL